MPKKTELITLNYIYETQNIVTAFKKAKRKNFFPGIDGFDCRSINDEEKFISNFINNINNYIPKPVKKEVVKSYCNTKFITFEVSCFSDRILEYAIRNKLVILVDPLFCSFVCGNRGNGNKNYYHLLEQLKSNYKLIVSFDIKNFYKSINKEILLKKLEIYCEQNVIKLIDKIVFRGLDKGLPLGHVLSPILSNIYLMSIDNFFRNYPIVRFGDNYIFGINHDNEYSILERKMIVLLEREGLEINKHKAMLFKSSEMKGVL